MTRLLAVIALAMLVAACAARRPAPVIDRLPAEAAPPPAVQAVPPAEAPSARALPTHTVKRGETLVGIALQHGLDYRELAAWNYITNPNQLTVGQVLVVAAPPGAKPAGPVATPLAPPGPIEGRALANTPQLKVEPRAEKVPFSERALARIAAGESSEPPGPPAATPPAATPTPAPPEPERPAGTDREDIDWMWPVKGKVIGAFTESSKGVDIAGRKGAPVVAAAAGRVVYAGAGLRGYGKLVIIKHNNTWLSAYAHNDNLLVKEQQDVRRGEKIAEMGATDADQVKLHFEVRRQGKPVDPSRILPPM
jgi:lipoprotein NlpD